MIDPAEISDRALSDEAAPTHIAYAPGSLAPALERAAHEASEWETFIDTDGVPSIRQRQDRTPQGVAAAVLAAALDVEEMARAALPYIGTFEGLSEGEQAFRRGIARNIRSWILGRDS